jgi:hypothetical protein
VDAAILAHWLERGAPIGLAEEIQLSGVFPAVRAKDRPGELKKLVTELEGFSNYSSANGNPEIVEALIEGYASEGWCKIFASHAELASFLGTRDITYNKMALISKPKADGSFKHRIIWDLRRSHVNGEMAIGERLVLPRLSDAIEDALAVLRARQAPGEEAEWLVVDVANAFFNVPLSPLEWRYHCCRLGDRAVVFTCLLFGAGSSPGIWGRYAAWIGRSTAACFSDTELRMQVFVDDPLAIARGSLSDRTLRFTMALLWICIAGFPLSWPKGKVGQDVRWIGANLVLGSGDVVVSVPQERSVELEADTNRFLRAGTIRASELRAYAGKVSFYAGFITHLKPFLSCVWASLCPPEPPRANDGTLLLRPRTGLPPAWVHTKRCRHALEWLRVFFERAAFGLSRSFSVDPPGPVEACVSTDASPWGIGHGAGPIDGLVRRGAAG